MRRFIARHGLDAFKFNPHFPVNTLQLMRGVVAAESLGSGPRYVEAMLAAMWERALKMDDPTVIAAALTDAELDADGLPRGAQDSEVKARRLSNTQAAHDRGAFGSPSFLVGDELFFGKDRLREDEQANASG